MVLVFTRTIWYYTETVKHQKHLLGLIITSVTHAVGDLFFFALLSFQFVNAFFTLDFYTNKKYIYLHGLDCKHKQEGIKNDFKASQEYSEIFDRSSCRY